MSTTSTSLGSVVGLRPMQHSVTVYAKEAKYEFLKLLRLPIYTVSTIAFPLMFYILFGLVLNRGNKGELNAASYLIGTYGTFGVMGASLFGTAASLAAERGLGWLQVKRASPMPPPAYFTAKVVMSMLFSATVVTLLVLLGVTLGGVHPSFANAIRMIAILTAGSLPFCAMGLAIGYFAGPNSAPASINLIYLPLSFCSGLWVPIMFLPRFLQKIALVLPPYHLSQLGLGIVGADQGGSVATHWEVLAGFTLICLGIARIGFQRDEGRLYG
jgi:ABC-2 type transport system permease protein